MKDILLVICIINTEVISRYLLLKKKGESKSDNKGSSQNELKTYDHIR